MLQHLKYSLPDWALCLLASVGLGINVVQSFLLPEALSKDVLRLAILCAAVIAVLVLLSYSKVTTILSVVLVIIGIVAVLCLSYIGQVKGFTENADPETNTRLWYLVAALCAALVYLLSRTRFTSWLLLILGSLCIAYFAILEYTVYLWGALLFLFSMGAWLCFLGYRKSMLKYSAVRTAFAPMAAWAMGVALLCLAVGSLLWWGIIRPIQPPTQDLVLLTDYLKMELLEQLGLIDETELYDSSTFSSWLNENLTHTTNEQQEVEDSDTQKQVGGAQEAAHEEEEDAEIDLPVTQQDGTAHWIRYSGLSLVQMILIGVLIALLAAILLTLFLLRRRIWYRIKTKDMDDGAYIDFFFPWFLARFRRLKLPRPMGESPVEYAQRVEASTRFLEDTGVTWQELSEVFSRLVYGGRPPLPGDREKFEQFYKGFYRCCRRQFRFAWLLYALRV